LVKAAHIVGLRPFTQTNPGINPDDFTIVEYLVYRVGSGTDAFPVLVVDHAHGEWLPMVRKIFPPFHFVDAKLDWWRDLIISMVFAWTKPRQLDLRKLHLMDLATFGNK
jgi:hypothetical protein